MKEKLKNDRGFTLVEMLCAVAILVLLCLMLNTGLNMAVKTYREITAESETQLLLNSLVDGIAGELRYADVEGEDESFTYNGGCKLILRDNRVVIQVPKAGGASQTVELLPTGKKDDDDNIQGGAYHGGNYKAENINEKSFISYNKDTKCFTVNLKVTWGDGKISAETPEDGVVIRCLNPQEPDNP